MFERHQVPKVVHYLVTKKPRKWEVLIYGTGNRSHCTCIQLQWDETRMTLVSVADTEEEEVWWKGFVAQVMLSSIQFIRSVVSNSLWPHGLQHTRPPCPSPTPGVHPNACPLSRLVFNKLCCRPLPFHLSEYFNVHHLCMNIPSLVSFETLHPYN